jgi:hypothetical protein
MDQEGLLGRGERGVGVSSLVIIEGPYLLPLLILSLVDRRMLRHLNPLKRGPLQLTQPRLDLLTILISKHPPNNLIHFTKPLEMAKMGRQGVFFEDGGESGGEADWADQDCHCPGGERTVVLGGQDLGYGWLH